MHNIKLCVCDMSVLPKTNLQGQAFVDASIYVSQRSSSLFYIDWIFFQSSKGVFQQFPKFLSNATKEQPLVIMLDSLDQLSPLYGARKLSWFPRKLPAHVKFIVSTLPDQEYKCFPTLKVSKCLRFISAELCFKLLSATWWKCGGQMVSGLDTG